MSRYSSQRGAAEINIAYKVGDKGKLSNCFSTGICILNELVGQNAILKKPTETCAKCEFSAIVLNLKIYFFHYYSGLSQIDSK